MSKFDGNPEIFRNTDTNIYIYLRPNNDISNDSLKNMLCIEPRTIVCDIYTRLLIPDMYLFGDPLNRQTFRGSFVVSSWGDRPEGTDPVNRTREADLKQALFDLYRNSELRSCFVSAEILALDR